MTYIRNLMLRILPIMILDEDHALHYTEIASAYVMMFPDEKHDNRNEAVRMQMQRYDPNSSVRSRFADYPALIENPKPGFYKLRPEYRSYLPPDFVEQMTSPGMAAPEMMPEPASDSAVITDRLVQTNRRVAQGRFRSNLTRVAGGVKRCRVSGIDDPRLLRASHLKPWAACSTPAEKLDGNNGLWLAPGPDHLIDKFFMTFSDHGAIICAPDVIDSNLRRLGIDLSNNVGQFTPQQAVYLEWHRAQFHKRQEA